MPKNLATSNTCEQLDGIKATNLVATAPDKLAQLYQACGNWFVAALPDGCPNKGPQGNYTVQAGTYQVMVKSIGDRQVKPFTGSWSLDSSSKYSHCFYLVRESATR